jgi:hypothetical protein
VGTTTTTRATTTTTAATTTTTVASATATLAASKSGFTVTATFTVWNGAANVSGAAVNVQFVITGFFGGTYTASCTTNATGSCTVTQFALGTTVVTVTSITSTPPVASMPGPQTV